MIEIQELSIAGNEMNGTHTKKHTKTRQHKCTKQPNNRQIELKTQICEVGAKRILQLIWN